MNVLENSEAARQAQVCDILLKALARDRALTLTFSTNGTSEQISQLVKSEVNLGLEVQRIITRYSFKFSFLLLVRLVHFNYYLGSHETSEI